MPAQLISTCKPPKVSTASLTAARIDSSSVTSVLAKSVERPVWLCSLDNAIPASLFRSAITTLAPACVNNLTHASPSPDAPPGTNTPLSCNCIIFTFVSHSILDPHPHFLISTYQSIRYIQVVYSCHR